MVPRQIVAARPASSSIGGWRRRWKGQTRTGPGPGPGPGGPGSRSVRPLFGERRAIQLSICPCAGSDKKGRISSVSYATSSDHAIDCQSASKFDESSAVQGLCHLKRFVDARGDAMIEMRQAQLSFGGGVPFRAISSRV